AWTALALVIAQGILGGLTVKMFLPWYVSTAHATMAQAFFSITVVLALFTSRPWLEAIPEPRIDHRVSGMRTLSVLTTASILLQLILGAAFRHSGLRLLPHVISAVVVTALILWTSARVLLDREMAPAARRPANWMLFLLLLQLCLGVAAYMTHVVWG